ncbi:unnamed protein product [Acanthoscelides obtectus]|uniref:Uncharacterized protein n=1 Tax=Acanthoscelides obtectus TaxID=200917 RepID=A0A9P0KCE0_ACAOB|nr:unnamed protein product [Acanthoscelides obtectus]CAK1680011.1 hypothetical protein AOBTE_LOCUS32487 [Acanthoscelides obtectus]
MQKKQLQKALSQSNCCNFKQLLKAKAITQIFIHRFLSFSFNFVRQSNSYIFIH